MKHKKHVVTYPSNEGYTEKVVGQTCVDSGTIAITDPCYMVDRYNQKEWDLLGERMYPKNKPSNQHTTLFQEPHLGVVHTTRDGDGIYDIVATYDEEGRVVSVRVDFI